MEVGQPASSTARLPRGQTFVSRSPWRRSTPHVDPRRRESLAGIRTGVAVAGQDVGWRASVKPREPEAPPLDLRAPLGEGCPICGSRRTEFACSDVEDFEYFVKPPRPLALRRCLACECEYLHPRPTGDELPGFYPPDYHAYNEDHGVVASILVSMRARFRGRYYRGLLAGRPGRLFDVGAGDCRHFDELRRYCDIECAGVEIQPEVAARGRARGYVIVDGMLETMSLTGHEGRYDIVSMNHVIEHVIDPAAMLHQARRLLRPGGHVVGQLPTRSSWEARLFGRRWGGYHYPRHLQAFSRSGLQRLLESVGFDAVRVKP